MNLIDLNAARLSNRKCWQITRKTMRVDPRCRQKDLLQRYADELYATLQVVKTIHQATQQHSRRAYRARVSEALGSVMTPFLTAAYLNGYRDMGSVLDVTYGAPQLSVLIRDAQARAAYSAHVMTLTTEEREELADQKAYDKLHPSAPAPEVSESDRKTLDEDLERSEDMGRDVGHDTGSDDAWLYSKDRATRAVDYEGVRGYQIGAERALRGAGGHGGATGGGSWMKVWVIDPSGHDRDDICDDNEAAGPIPLGQAFPSGDMSDPAHPNCRCSVYYVRQ